MEKLSKTEYNQRVEDVSNTERIKKFRNTWRYSLFKRNAFFTLETRKYLAKL